MTSQKSDPPKNEMVDFLKKAIGLDSVSEETRHVFSRFCKKALENQFDIHSDTPMSDTPISDSKSEIFSNVRTYNDFMTLDMIEARFGITEEKADLFPDTSSDTYVGISEWLRTALDIGMKIAIPCSGRKARTEFITAPILMETKRLTQKTFSIFSGKPLYADRKKGLTGLCDFILTRSESIRIKPPVFVLLEMSETIDLGIGPCAARMVGASLFNQQRNHHSDAVFGCVSTGEVWQFLKLESDTIYIDSTPCYSRQI